MTSELALIEISRMQREVDEPLWLRELRGETTMSRSVEEWIGKTDDEPFPPRVKVRILERFKRRCANCGNKIVAGRWTCDHVKALINGGENRESNGQPLCDICNPSKNAADVAEKSATADTIKSHYGIAKAKHPVPGSRAHPSGLRKRMSGEVTKWRTP